ncbi:thiamine phosphate synthase [Ancylobacter sp. MQZ15Z-1]|uniref:Thiamine phosphate synthase n=1 Tax=Ancylobacter mangrovi TaxID=2972472 RepID=A0A9X2PM06_9HYPH|nr:thiamine phosphate synthase [Ancylobacter mangrovi]MCS0497567.1 thiamine phosphate synthase [Ancylobacter mangrovi]
MARSRTEPQPTAPRLYLLVPVTGAAEEIARLADTLTRAGGAVDIAAVLLRTGAADGEASSERLRPLVEAAHAIGAACLVEGNTALAGALGADGAHLDGPDALRAALPALRPDGIAGVGGLRSRHDAMTAGETADYVMFGEPDASGRRPAFDATLERAQWWAHLFEPPCVAYAATLEEVAALVAAGVDFVAVDGLVLDDPVEGARALAAGLGGAMATGAGAG